MKDTDFNLYTDSEGVTRGYYVYLHKSNATGEVFYVGKGCKGRAWEVKRRHVMWKEKVDSLAGAWIVEIAKGDLTEIEAYSLEAELVKEYGGPASDGGTLTNWLPGGENPSEVELGFSFNDGGWNAAYTKFRRFKNFSRHEQEAIVKGLDKELKSIFSKIRSLEEEAEEKEDEKLEDSAANLSGSINGLDEACYDFLRRRLRWIDFAMILDDTCDTLEMELVEIANYHRKANVLLKRTDSIVKKYLLEIDSGNKTEAEDLATQEVTITRKVAAMRLSVDTILKQRLGIGLTDFPNLNPEFLTNWDIPGEDDEFQRTAEKVADWIQTHAGPESLK